MEGKYLYFRTQADQANDDATGDSALFPLSSLMGMQPTSDTALTLYFKSIVRKHPGGSVDHANSLDNHDTVILTITSNRHKKVMKTILKESLRGYFTVIADDVTTTYLTKTNVRSGVAEDETVSASYIDSDITACGTITVAAIYANS